MSKQILHVGTLDKFIPSFIDFVETNFQPNEHFYVFADANTGFYLEKRTNLELIKPRKAIFQLLTYGKLAWRMTFAKKIMLHGLFNHRVVQLLVLMPWLLPKCYWFIWGGDLYRNTEHRCEDARSIAFRKRVISRLGHLVTYLPGDIEYARHHYMARGEYRKCILYLSNTVEEKAASPATSGPLQIQIGNSGSRENNHLEVLESLRKVHDEDVVIHCPLSYGDEVYIQQVIATGQRIFGERFKPMTEFVPLAEYENYLDSIDMAIFNHKRQQGMGNTIGLLGRGKLVYIRSDVSQWQLFESMGVQVKDSLELDGVDIATLRRNLNSEVTRENSRIIATEFSVEKLNQQLTDLFT